MRKNAINLLIAGLSHDFSELLLQLAGQCVAGIEPEGLVEAIEGLAVVARAVLLRVGHNEGGEVEAVERSQVGAVGSLGEMQGLYLADDALRLVSVLPGLAVVRPGAGIAKQECGLPVFRADAVGLQGLQALQGGELRGQGRRLRGCGGVVLRMGTGKGEQDEDKDAQAAHACCCGFRNWRCHKLYCF